ncbi:GntP family permease [Oenococcus kitaharae]|uniref:GntP family permease n=1 Tax=Oenococcus TaxID=46254 RepID=UPI0021E836FF|nr:GntP family permease [Oenococcus kitaharae]MCV3296243.1 GntP family permease [Oenococcus kitaharae]
MSLLFLCLSLVILVLLITIFKINAYIAIIIASIFLGLSLGMPVDKVMNLIGTGIGTQLGGLVLVFSFGAILGKLVADSGGAKKIADSLTQLFGKKHIQLAVAIAAFVIGLSMFFEVGVVVLVPIIFAVATEVDLPMLQLGLPMLMGLGTAHAYLPPHPAPVAISQVLHANLGTVLLLGICMGIPYLLITAVAIPKLIQHLFPKSFRKITYVPGVGDLKESKTSSAPSLGLSLITALMPVLLMSVATVLTALGTKNVIVAALNNSSFAMFISLMFALWSMGWHQHRSNKEILSTIEASISSIGMLLLVIGSAGGLKQIMVSGDLASQIAKLILHTGLSPLLLAWIMAALIRVSLGSTTVAALTTAGLILPIVGSINVPVALLVLAIGAGSSFGSHVNDAGFWMVNQYFNLTVKETFETWTLQSSLSGIVGLILVMIMSLFI